VTKPALAHEHPLAIAHRGTRHFHPENTMPAFQAAVDLGFCYLETDLHVTADGVVVCFHDDTVVRTTNGRGRVAAMTFEQLRVLDAGHRFGARRGFPARGKGIVVPSLEDLATTFPDAVLILDLKQDAIERSVADLIERLGMWERVIVGSFSDKRLQAFRALARGRAATSTGSGETYRIWRAARKGLAVDTPADALQVPITYRGIRVVDRKTIDAAHASGLQVHVWTVNRPDQMNRLLDLGVDGIISDRIDLLKQVYLARGKGGPWNPAPIP
jgi:glycerophosphoryl diester phosphodiesterase